MEPTILAGLRVLAAQDNPDIQRFLGISLRGAGAVVTVVGDGQKAVDAVIAEPFDVVLMDIDMPVLDGLEATSRLREQGFKGAIIALTASGETAEFWTCASAGFNGHLRQPIGSQQLIAVLAPFARQRAAATAQG